MIKFKAEIQKVENQKKGYKVVLFADKEKVTRFFSNIDNFLDKPVTVELLVDEKEQKQRLNQITEEQRKKIYAIIRDIAEHVGDHRESQKEFMKAEYCQDVEQEDFSLSDCSKELASDFLEWLVQWSFEHGVPLSEHPRQAFDDIYSYIDKCSKSGVCVVCGKPAEKHHLTGFRIGMGRDRSKVEDEEGSMLPLCRVHHTEMHSMPEEEFLFKYHL